MTTEESAYDKIERGFRTFNAGPVELPVDIIKGHLIMPIDRICDHIWGPWTEYGGSLNIVRKWHSECSRCKERRYVESFR